MELGSHIKARRTELGISQDELAGRIYVSRQTISSWENATRPTPTSRACCSSRRSLARPSTSS